MIEGGLLKCNICGEAVKTARIMRIFTRYKRIEEWDVCESCCKEKGWMR